MRLVVEAALVMIVAEMAIMVVLRAIAPDASGPLAATLDAVLLVAFASPALMWRLQRKPLMSEAKPVGRLHAGRLALACGAITCGGIAASSYMAVRLERSSMSEARARFDALADSVLRAFASQVDDSHGVIHGASSLYAASQSVERDEFRAYVRSQNIAKQIPGALGIGVIERVERADLGEFIDRTRADGAADFEVWANPAPEGTIASDILFVVKYIEPLDTNRPAWGYDMGSERVRRDAIERAIRTGEPTITSRVTLLQDAQRRSGFLYLLPIYRGGDTPTSEAERIQALDGLIYAPVVLETTRDQVCRLANGMLDLEVFDGESVSEETLLFDTDDQALSQFSPDARNRFTRVS